MMRTRNEFVLPMFKFMLRSQFSTLLVIISLAVTSWVLSIRSMGSLGESMMTIRWASMALPILYPIVAGFSAVDVSRLRRSTLYVGTIAREKKLRFLLLMVAAPGALGALGFAIPVIIFILVGGNLDPNGGWPRLLLALFAQLVVFFSFSAIGVIIGYILPAFGSGITGVAVSLLLLHFLNATSADQGAHILSPFMDNGASVSQIGVVFNPSHLFARIFIAIVFCLTAVIFLSAARSTRGRIYASGSSLVGLIVLCAIAGGLVTSYGLEDDYRRPDQCIDISGSSFCAFSEHMGRLKKISPDLGNIIDVAENGALSTMIAGQYDEMSLRYQPREVGVRAIPTLGRRNTEISEIIYWMIYPMSCSALSAPTLTRDGEEILASVDEIVDYWTGLYEGNLDSKNLARDVDSDIQRVLSCDDA